MDLDTWAARAAEELLVPLGRRWSHTQGVARRADEFVTLVAPEDAALLRAAAYLHDIGYAPTVAVTGFHPLDGARYLKGLGAGQRLCCLVAYHSGATFEAEERGLADELAEFERGDDPLLDALTSADMTTSPDGEPVEFEDRMEEILRRYADGDPVHRAITRSRPVLRTTIARTLARLDRQPI